MKCWMPFIVTAVAVAFASAPETASACTVCMGDANSKTGAAMNAAIFLMLGCIGSMLSLLAAFGWYLMKRASSPVPPEREFFNMLNQEEGN